MGRSRILDDDIAVAIYALIHVVDNQVASITNANITTRAQVTCSK
jgi:hypothetical protein